MKMTQFLELNFAEYNLNQDFMRIVSKKHQICVCCLTQNSSFVNLMQCKHVDFFEKFFKFKMEYAEIIVCNQCHSFLKKIDLFKQQVEESFFLMKEQSHLKFNTKFNLARSKTIITSINTEPIILEIKPEDNEETESETTNQHPGLTTNHDEEYDTTTEIKIEPGYSDFETELPISKIRKHLGKKKKKNDSKKKGKEVVKNHTRTTPNDPYKGKICTIKLTREEAMTERDKNRMKKSYLKLPYKCEDCITGFDHDLTLKDHLEKRHTMNEGSYQCDICKSVLTSDASYKEHYKRHFRRYKCEACGKRNNTLHAVVKHYNESHDPIGENYTCQDCGYSTKFHRKFRYHLDSHKEKPQCSLCGNLFINKAGLKSHMFTVHKQSSRVYSCEACNKVYNAKSGLLAHIAGTHTGSASYCEPCGTHYRSEATLRAHLRSHSRHVNDGDKRFICDECGGKYMTKRALQEHIDWVHLNSGKYKCTKCSKTFKNNSGLQKHKTFVHEKKRPPRNKICDHCGRGFTTLTILRSHIRTHTGERPLQCAHCPANFAHSAALYTHNKLLHSGAR